MDVEKEIKVSRDMINILRVGGLIKRGGISFSDVVALIPKDKYLQQRASHVLIHTLEYHKYQPTQDEIIALASQLQVDGMIEGAYRNILRSLGEIGEYPEEVEGFLFDYSLKAITSMKRPLAVRAFAITVAFNVAKKYPELLEELRSVLMLLPEEDGVSVKTRKRDYLIKINRAQLKN